MREYKRIKEKLDVIITCPDLPFSEDLTGEELKKIYDIILKIENGTLIELPCKVGDTVYNIYKECSKCQYFKDYAYTDYVECTLNDDKCMFEFDFDKDCIYAIYETVFTYSMIDKIGKSIFSTKAEAEQKLKELKGEV